MLKEIRLKRDIDKQRDRKERVRKTWPKRKREREKERERPKRELTKHIDKERVEETCIEIRDREN